MRCAREGGVLCGQEGLGSAGCALCMSCSVASAVCHAVLRLAVPVQHHMRSCVRRTASSEAHTLNKQS